MQNREEKVQCIVRRAADTDMEAVLTDVFAQDVDNLFLEARDATVHILVGFGARIIGAPVPFYRGNVTPVELTREAFLHHIH